MKRWNTQWCSQGLPGWGLVHPEGKNGDINEVGEGEGGGTWKKKKKHKWGILRTRQFDKNVTTYAHVLLSKTIDLNALVD